MSDHEHENYDTEGQEFSETISRQPTVQSLEEESEIAADYLEEFLDIVDIDGDIDLDVAQNRAQVAVIPVDEDTELPVLVGKNGEVLHALQDLTRLAVSTTTGERSGLLLDINRYRAKHNEDIRRTARIAIDEVKETQSSQSLDAMNSFERKIVHDMATESGIRSESRGDGRDRHVVLFPN